MTLTVRRSAGTALALILGVFALVSCVLTGCAQIGGQSSDAARGQLAAIVGVPESSVDVSSSTSGLREETVVYVSIRIEDGYRVADEERLAAFLVDVAWSINDERPIKSLAVAVDVPEGQVLDAHQAAKDAGLAEAFGSPDLFQIPLNDARGEKSLERLGDWPGAVPVLPDGVIVPVE